MYSSEFLFWSYQIKQSNFAPLYYSDKFDTLQNNWDEGIMKKCQLCEKYRIFVW